MTTMDLHPIHQRFIDSLIYMTDDELQKELKYLMNPTTDNRITLSFLEVKADLVRGEIAKREQEKAEGGEG